MRHFIAAVGIVVLSAASLMAQGYNDRADSKVLGGYRPYSTHAYQSSALANARALEHYAATGGASKATAEEHATAIRRDVSLADKELAKLEASVKDDKVATDLIAEIKTHQANAVKACGMVETECAKHAPDASGVTSCCTKMTTELKAAADAHAKLMQHLKVAPPHNSAK